jgi:hypothetical protein
LEGDEMAETKSRAHIIKHRGLVLRKSPGLDWYSTDGKPIRLEVYPRDDYWEVILGIGDNGETSGEAGTIAGAIDLALENACEELADTVRSLTKERKRIVAILERDP